MKKYLLPLLCVLLATTAFSQSNQITLSAAMVKAGDDPRWRTKQFDESKDEGWAKFKLSKFWDEQGLGDYDGFAIYRIRFTLPAQMYEQSAFKDSLLLYMGKIDDSDEVYFNGKLIGSTGRMPENPLGYVGAHNEERNYKMAANDPAIVWGGENVIAVRVYDGGGNGGMTEGMPYIRMVDFYDGLKIENSFSRGAKGETAFISIVNLHKMRVSGQLSVTVVDTESGETGATYNKKIKVNSGAVASMEMPYSSAKRYRLDAVFIDDKTGQKIEKQIIVPYILTPKAKAEPSINGANVFGVRPLSPVLYKIAASGERPIIYSVTNLPQGLDVDPSTGIITGSIATAGEYKMILRAKNAKGEASREFTIKVGDLLTLTPPMGWNSWNCWGVTVSDQRVRSSAQAILDKGLDAYGWTYVNVDDSWERPAREADGRLLANEKFPDMRGLGDWLHDRGLKFGIYTSPGALTCGNYLGSYQHERQDAEMFAEWGIDYVKYDWCGYSKVYDREGDHSLTAFIKPYLLMGNILKQQNRDIVYSLCQYGMRDVWEWGPITGGNLWRTTGDITDTWESMYHIGFERQAGLSRFAGPGRWNDPDMLIIGKLGWGSRLRDTRLTYDEQYTHISLWCLLSSPLLLGCDISHMDDFTLGLLTNAEVLAVNQDPLGRQADRVFTKGDVQVWMKKLEDGSHAVGIFNLGGQDDNVSVELSELGLPGKVNVRDLWRQKDLGEANSILQAKIPSHGVVLLKVR